MNAVSLNASTPANDSVERASVQRLYADHVDSLRALARSLLGDRFDAYDVVQDVFVDLLAGDAVTRGPRHRSDHAWLQSLVRNACTEMRRRRGRDGQLRHELSEIAKLDR